MSKKSAVPDAWDDDWESQADKADAAAAAAKVEEEVKITKAQRLALHAETNKKIWESAETPETPYFLAAHDTVPLKQEFKPMLKVLSRKPAPDIDPLTGLAKITLEDDDEDQKKNQPSPEELRLRAQRELEERQRKYAERRAELMAESGKPVTPTNEKGRQNTSRGKGRGAGRQENRRPNSQSGSKELFDPNYTPKPGVLIQKRNGDSSRGGSGRSTPREEEGIIRKPRGPDGTAGFGGFANRDGKTS